jgi:hypothetical protein
MKLADVHVIGGAGFSRASWLTIDVMRVLTEKRLRFNVNQI